MILFDLGGPGPPMLWHDSCLIVCIYLIYLLADTWVTSPFCCCNNAGVTTNTQINAGSVRNKSFNFCGIQLISFVGCAFCVIQGHKDMFSFDSLV